MTTKPEIIESFKSSFEDFKAELKDDRIAIVCAWNDYVDSLRRDGVVSDWQGSNWVNPFDTRRNK